MGHATQVYKRSLAGSLGAGVKSVMGGEGRKYYTLVHKVSSKYHKSGESQPIIVDQIEIGRDPKCQVRFDEQFTTVSRRHAAIVRDGDNWKLVQLSQTNSTYLNGRKVQKEWYLQNGDEIQLSTNGPKLGFIIPEGKKSTIGSIGLTNRLSLFRQQALAPYKNALWSIAIVLVVVCLAGGLLLNNTNKELKSEKEARALAEAQWQEEKSQMQLVMDDMSKKNTEISEKLEKSKKDIAKLKGDINKINSGSAPAVSASVNNKSIEKCLPYVYYISVVGFEIRLPDGSGGYAECGKDFPSWSGTGFLLSDGVFVTARHVIEAWSYWLDGNEVDEPLRVLNAITNNGGSVIAHFVCASSSGSKFKCTSKQFTCNRSQDQYGKTEDGVKLSLASLDASDYAYMRTSISGGLAYDKQLSRSLERGSKLTVLGFPLGIGASSKSINPIYGSAIVASPGLHEGVILTTDTNYERGNSGGPVFYTSNSGELVTVGIVSAGAGRNLGLVVPLSAIK